ncbi:Retinoblastoma-binding protein [Coemansia sp. RSA 2611]|nr:Retinoblastoma-binding protein [Coemansia sp. RSA 2611]
MRPEHQHPPPPGYVCHRCGTQGHWIYNCPTMSQGLDGSKPGMHRVKRTTGIPKSFLQKVENLDDVGNALVTSDGTLVVATANEAAWKTAQRLSRNAISTDDDIDSSLVPDTLKCNTCAKLVRDAVAAPCCKTVFCSACIEGQLLDPGPMHFTCPKCRSGLVPDQLEVASETRGKVDEFLREYSSRHNAADESEKPANGTNGASSNIGKPPATTVTVVSAAPAPAAAIAVPAATTSPAATTAPAPAAQRPPTQVPPRPRPPMGMVPGMMMGGFPGLPMGQMPFMGGMVPPGMMGQWNGTAPSQDSQPSRGPDNTGRRGSTSEHELPPHESRSRNSSRARRDHSRVRSSSRADRDRSRDSHSRRRDYSRERSSSRYRESRRDSHRESRRGSHRDDDRRDSHREDDRRDSRRDESRRDSRRDEDRRESRRDDDHRDSRSRRRGDSAERRRHSGRSRSPASRSSHSRRRGGDSKPAELSIRGQSSIAAGESKPRSIAERLNDTRASDRSNGRSGGRRNRLK